MPANALESLIRTCAAASPAEAQDVQEAQVQPRKCAPIASFGFWAQNEIPLSMGTSALERSSKTSEPASLTDEATPSIALDEELKVRDRLAKAKEMAQVGDDIRWDLILEAASAMPCKLKVDSLASGLKKAPLTDDEDHRSTSASGSGGAETDETELEASSNDETGESGKDAPPTPDAKLPPWRRARATTTDSLGSGQESPVPAVSPPWRRGGSKAKGEDAARVYSITTLLQCWMLMQQTPTAIVEAECAEADCQEAEEQKSTPPPPGFAPIPSSAGAAKSSVKDAPWRRRPQTSSPATSAEA